MRPTDRIERITKLLKELWEQHPDQRFGQFLINCGLAKDDFEYWSMEDDALEEGLRKSVNKGEPKK